MVKKLRKKRSLAFWHGFTGWMFVMPFVIGFLFLFFIPFLQSFTWIFSKVEINPGRIYIENVGLANINRIWNEDPEFKTQLSSSFTNLLLQVPVVVIFSFFFAVILNQKFWGRTLARAIFFLPVIVASGVVIDILRGDSVAQNLMSGSGGNIFGSTGLQSILINAGFNSNIVQYFTDISNSLFDYLWKIGVQMIIFLAGLQTISPSLYEVSAIEGATAWENFWMITFPMILPILFLNIIYSIIDSMTDSSNYVMMSVIETSRNGAYADAATMSWMYTLGIVAILGIVTLIYRGFVKGGQAE